MIIYFKTNLLFLLEPLKNTKLPKRKSQPVDLWRFSTISKWPNNWYRTPFRSTVFLSGFSKNSVSEGRYFWFLSAEIFWLNLPEMVLIHTFWSNQVHNHLLCPKMHELPHNKQDIVCPRVHQQGTRVLSRKVYFNYLGFKGALNQNWTFFYVKFLLDIECSLVVQKD